MKKLLAAMLALTMVFAFAACGNDQAEDPGTTPDNDSDGTKVVTMATSADFPPYEYYEGEEIVGADVEIAQAICEKLGYELEIVDMNFDSIISALASHKYDFGMSGFTITEDRLKDANFSVPYMETKQIVLVPTGSPITSVDDLLAEGSTYKVAVQNGTTGDIFITEDVEENGLGLQIDRYTKYSDAVLAVTSGKADCMIVDEQVGLAFAEQEDNLEVLDTAYAVEEYAIAFAKDSDLYESFNTALQELIDDGTVQTILDKYIDSDSSAE